MVGMQFEVGEILEGKVTGITKFGAFVELPGGKTGLVHISEVAPTFVKEIKDHVTENQIVKVKVLNVSEDGKIGLSIKRAMEPERVENQGQGNDRRFQNNGGANRPPQQRKPRPRNDTYEWAPRRQQSSENMSFEDMMAKFKQSSDDKMSDLKKYMDVKHGTSRRGQPK